MKYSFAWILVAIVAQVRIAAAQDTQAPLDPQPHEPGAPTQTPTPEPTNPPTPTEPPPAPPASPAPDGEAPPAPDSPPPAPDSPPPAPDSPPPAPDSPPPAAAFPSSPEEGTWNQTRLPPSSATPFPAPTVESGAAPATSQSATSFAQPSRADDPVGAPAPKKDDAYGLFGPLRIGPMIGVGLPNLLSFGGMLKLTRYFGAGLNVGIIPTVKISYYGDATLSYQEYDIYARIFPFGGGFFLGSGVGYETAKGTLKNHFDISAYARRVPELGLPNSIDAESNGSARTLVLTPQLGYLHTFAAGFSVGFDFGAQLPIAPSKIDFKTRVSDSVPQTLVDQYLGPNQEKVRDTLEKIARTPIPTFNFRIGWLL